MEHVFLQFCFSVFGEVGGVCACIVMHSVAAICELKAAILQLVLSRSSRSGLGRQQTLAFACSAVLSAVSAQGWEQAQHATKQPNVDP